MPGPAPKPSMRRIEIRLAPQVLERLAALEAYTGLDRQAVVATAINELHRAYLGKPSPGPHPAAHG